MSDHALAMFDQKPTEESSGAKLEVVPTQKIESASYVEDLVEVGIQQLIDGAITLMEEKKSTGEIKERFFAELASRKLTFL